MKDKTEDFLDLVEELIDTEQYTGECPNCNEYVTLSPEEILEDFEIDIKVDGELDKLLEETFSCPNCQVILMVVNTLPLEFESLDYETENIIDF